MHADVVREILKVHPEFAWKLDQEGLSPLHLASRAGNAEVTSELLRADPHLCFQKIDDKRTPLHLAAIGGHISVMNVILSMNINLANMPTVQGETVLHLSVKNNRLDAVKYLLEERKMKKLAKLTDNKGNTILHLATCEKLPDVRSSYFFLLLLETPLV